MIYELGDRIVFKSSALDGEEHIGILIGIQPLPLPYRNRLVQFDDDRAQPLTSTFISSWEVDATYRGKRALQIYDTDIIRLFCALPHGGYHCWICNHPNPYAEANYGNKWVCRGCWKTTILGVKETL